MSTVMVNDKGEVVNGRMRVLAAREMNRRLAKKGRSSVKVPVDRKAPRRMTVREAWHVGSRQRWHMSDVVKIVKRVRNAQVGSPNATFLAQTGIYKPPGGKAVTERGAQVILIDEQGLDPVSWATQMEQLGEVLASELRQKEVLVEIQHGGMVVEAFGVEA